MYTESDFERFRRLEHRKLRPSCRAEWVFPEFGEPVVTFDRITYFNAYADRSEMTFGQQHILATEGVMGCPPFSDPYA